MQLVLSGSSFLLPKNKSWNSLEKKFKLEFCDYGNWSGALINSKIEDAIAVILFLDDLVDHKNKTEDEIRLLLDSFINLLVNRLSKSKSPILVFFSSCDTDHLFIKARKITKNDKINQWLMKKLSDLAEKYFYLYFFDIDKIFSEVGFESSLDKRNWYIARSRFSAKGIKQIANVIERILNRYKFSPSKMLLLDCDNTIWGGVIGEDGLKGIELGQDGLGKAFVDFQLALKKLSSEGILLALVSKNNESEVWNVFENHNSMVLKKEDIVSFKLDWNEKFYNIKKISNEINIGLDSLVFWDDNPIERDKVKNMLPEVCTIDVPSDVFQWQKYLENLDCFAKFNTTKEDLSKTEQYRSRAEFIKESAAVTDEHSYLKSIGLRASAFGLDESNISRAVQLCSKTNQFNLRTIRHNSEDLYLISKKNKDFVFLTKLLDKYGDHGIVGLVCLVEINPEIIFLDTFLLSCRILGRHFETWMLYQSLIRAKKNNYKYLVGEFIDSGRNVVAKNFFIENRFQLIKNLPDNFIYNKINNNFYIMPTSHANFPFLDIYENIRS
jgi:FkbH-like protein